jgi:hypothetical protein
MNDTMTFSDLEQVYDAVAQAIDSAGPEHEALLLSKLCLALAHEIGDRQKVMQALELALRDLKP